MTTETRQLPIWHLANSSVTAAVAPDRVTEVAAETWSGCFERIDFDSGLYIHRGSLRIRADSEIAVSGSGGVIPIAVQYVLKGKTYVHPEDHPPIALSPRVAMLSLNRSRAGTFVLPGPQQFEYFSIAVPPLVLIALLDGKIPAMIEPLLEPTRDEPYSGFTVRLGPALRAVLRQLSGPGAASVPVRRLRFEGIALQCLAEILDQVSSDSAAREPQPLSAAERERVVAARALLTADLSRPPSVAAAAKAVGLNSKRLLQGFKDGYGESPTQLLRRERLALARTLIEEEGMALKDVAWRVGYAHVTNLISAFTAEFGESPGRLRERTRTARPKR